MSDYVPDSTIGNFLSEERLNKVIKWHKFYELCKVEPVTFISESQNRQIAMIPWTF